MISEKTKTDMEKRHKLYAQIFDTLAGIAINLDGHASGHLGVELVKDNIESYMTFAKDTLLDLVDIIPGSKVTRKQCGYKTKINHNVGMNDHLDNLIKRAEEQEVVLKRLRKSVLGNKKIITPVGHNKRVLGKRDGE